MIESKWRNLYGARSRSLALRRSDERSCLLFWTIRLWLTISLEKEYVIVNRCDKGNPGRQKWGHVASQGPAGDGQIEPGNKAEDDVPVQALQYRLSLPRGPCGQRHQVVVVYIHPLRKWSCRWPSQKDSWIGWEPQVFPQIVLPWAADCCFWRLNASVSPHLSSSGQLWVASGWGRL